MSTASANGAPVIRGTIRMARYGLWLADLVVDLRAQISGPVRIEVGELVFLGTAVRTGEALEASVLRVVAGNAGLSGTVPARFYRLATAGNVAHDILGAAGETLAGSSDAGALARQLPAYCQLGDWSAGDSLGYLCRSIGAIWRALPDGTIWIGQEIWPAVDPPGQSVWTDPASQSEGWGVEVPSLVPGCMVGGRAVSSVEHQIDPDQIRTVVWYDSAVATSEDRQTRAFRLSVERLTAQFDFLAMYGGSVVSQGADGTLDIRMENPRIPGLTKVPIRYGLPGCSAKVAPGSRVLVGFEEGDPAQPVAALWTGPTATEIQVSATSSATISAPAVNLGSSPAIEPFVKGATYRAAEDAKFLAQDLSISTIGALVAAMCLNPTMAAYLAGIPGGPALIAAAAGAVSANAIAASTFSGLSATMLSTVVKGV